jgi:hypothetical protein
MVTLSSILYQNTGQYQPNIILTIACIYNLSSIMNNATTNMLHFKSKLNLTRFRLFIKIVTHQAG